VHKLKKYLTDLNLADLAIPSNIRYGTAIFERAGVEIIIDDNTMIEAWSGGLDGKSIAGGGSRRRVLFQLNDEGLVWSCTGNPKKHNIFCKHCVSVALFLRNL
jgi:hypothetical protein